MVATLLVIEDNREINEYLQKVLSEVGYIVQNTSSGTKALKLLQKIQPDLILLDLGLPDINGETFCKEAKKDYPDIPIIILTGKSRTIDVVSGLNFGADDYITKPFEREVLIARIKSRLRSNKKGNGKMQVGDLILDTNSMEVKRGDKKIKLTAQEFRLLEYIMRNHGRVLSRDMILNRIWLASPDIETRVVDVYIGYLRKKIDAGFKKKLIQSIRGFGYVIKE